MKVLFLDVDGVLNHAECDAKSPNGYLGVSEDALRLLAEIIAQTGAKIVLTSTWKEVWEKREEDIWDLDGQYLVEQMKQHGLRIMNKTEDEVLDRGRGIRLWLARHEPVESWVVLDDKIYGDYEKYEILPHLVKTSFGGAGAGLQPEHVEQAIKILNPC